ncbi:serine protease grass-like [Culex pipiens pallens]|uniref:serine protease grass-like n=1 Tax=Culex pipiens pallens TaxID=42434 RepID=UPI001952F1E2|nr:serine protease grass-like [Culex pipiens pallens]
MVCRNSNGTGLCYGDVGGGLYNVVDGMWHVIGVLFEAPPKENDQRCVTKSYALYNSVDYYKQFILKYTGLSYLDRDKTTINATDIKSSPKRSNLFPKQCGNFIPNKQPDSEDVHTMEQPWLAIIGRKDADKKPSFYCLGTLINKRYVLTSAACIYKGGMNTVRLGENSLNKIKNCSVNPEPDCFLLAQDFEVQYHIHHESYDKKNQIHDIGLTRLLKDVVYQDHIQPVCLPVTDDLKKQQLSQYVLAGWHEGWNTFLSFVKPQKETVQRMELTECLEQRKSLNSSIKLFEDAIFCTNDTVHFSKCIGYGGEPLGYPVQHNNERYVQFGIRSFRDNCRFFSLVYTNISYYMDWIMDNMEMDAPQEGRVLLKRKGTDFLIRS